MQRSAGRRSGLGPDPGLAGAPVSGEPCGCARVWATRAPLRLPQPVQLAGEAFTEEYTEGEGDYGEYYDEEGSYGVDPVDQSQAGKGREYFFFTEAGDIYL